MGNQPKPYWRNVKKEDIKRGVVVRFRDNEPFYDCVIVGVRVIDAKYGEKHIGRDEVVGQEIPHEAYVWVDLARPYIYANEHYDSRNGLMGVESFSVELRRMCDDSYPFMVCECTNGRLYTMTT